jgi:hypothetical protein
MLVKWDSISGADIPTIFLNAAIDKNNVSSDKFDSEITCRSASSLISLLFSLSILLSFLLVI